jgi:hypothetical protein
MSNRNSVAASLELLVLLSIAIAGSSVVAAGGMPAQVSVPNGTILPISLSTSLTSRKSKPGQAVAGRLMQDVPLGQEGVIRSGARITGHIISISPASNGSHAKISFVFDAIQIHHSTIHVFTNIRALASPLEIDIAQLPDTGPDRGTPPNAFTTVQVGGEVVYRGGGPVARGETVVGEPVPGGVLVNVRAAEGQPCRGALDGNLGPQALWLFSSDACGVYGYSQVAIAHAGRTNPTGEIALAATDDRDLDIRAGSGMLLRVDAR